MDCQRGQASGDSGVDVDALAVIAVAGINEVVVVEVPSSVFPVLPGLKQLLVIRKRLLAVRSIVRIPQQIEVAFFDWAAAKKVDKVRLMLSILLYGLFKLFL